MLRQAKIIHRITLVLVTLGLFAPQIHDLLHLAEIDELCKDEHSSMTHVESSHVDLDCGACTLGLQKTIKDEKASSFSVDVSVVDLTFSQSESRPPFLRPAQRGPPVLA